MKLTPIFKCFGRRGLIDIVVLLLCLWGNATAQAAQSQGSRGLSGQPDPRAIKPQEHRAQISPADPHSCRVNRARVVLVFPPCGYGNYYDSGPHSYCDQGKSSVAIGVHAFNN